MEERTRCGKVPFGGHRRELLLVADQRGQQGWWHRRQRHHSLQLVNVVGLNVAEMDVAQHIRLSHDCHKVGRKIQLTRRVGRAEAAGSS